jgi:putative transposase
MKGERKSRSIPGPDGWLAHVNAAMTPGEEEAIGRCTHRGRPFGGPDWQAEAIARLGLESTTRPAGRPRKPAEGR